MDAELQLLVFQVVWFLVDCAAHHFIDALTQSLDFSFFLQ